MISIVPSPAVCAFRISFFPCAPRFVESLSRFEVLIPRQRPVTFIKCGNQAVLELLKRYQDTIPVLATCGELTLLLDQKPPAGCAVNLVEAAIEVCSLLIFLFSPVHISRVFFALVLYSHQSLIVV